MEGKAKRAKNFGELWPTFLGSTNFRLQISRAFFQRSPQNLAWVGGKLPVRRTQIDSSQVVTIHP